MTVRVRTLAGLTLALVVGVVAVPKTAPVPAQAKLLAFNAQAKALLAKMTLEEKVAQMTQPDQLFIKDGTEIEKSGFGSVLSGGDSDPKTNTVEDWGAMYEEYPGARAEVAPEDPAPLRRRRGARAQQRDRRGDLPAQRRPGRHARREARREDRPHHGARSPRHRHQLGVLAVRHRAARRALGPRVRRLQRGPGARGRARRGRSPRDAGHRT